MGEPRIWELKCLTCISEGATSEARKSKVYFKKKKEKKRKKAWIETPGTAQAGFCDAANGSKLWRQVHTHAKEPSWDLQQSRLWEKFLHDIPDIRYYLA